MDKRHRARLFQERLQQALNEKGISRAQLARSSGVDRSTISQLLNPDMPRLPNAHAAAEMAQCLQTSSDWLLGLSEARESLSQILEASVQIRGVASTPTDENIQRWREEALGKKIRYIPKTIPDLMKTDAILFHEYGEANAVLDNASQETSDHLAHSRLPESDMEICMPIQQVEALAAGYGIWDGLSRRDRMIQLEYMADLSEELYPGLRFYLYDDREIHAIPSTTFGHQRAIIFTGQSFFVFNTRTHIMALINQFDSIIRNAVILDRDLPDHIRGILKHL